jgi:hypothetical protein
MYMQKLQVTPEQAAVKTTINKQLKMDQHLL